MIEKLNTLLSARKISKEQHDLYLLFTQPLGAEFLKNKLMSVAMEESPRPTNAAFAWTDGRRSVLRDWHNTINHIDYLLEEKCGNNES
ncbi:hypothetical protein [Rickettsiella endosymbiont of Dermanyssus gallinae]|uniref:hypothetical protein n=1 Tax=Rickettsiella endosymbiont of Dermanyssus gallinae TaxID=2856608 RepID=UPI001C53132E|nr:hypothetical protein [Rickettsiella endosymbiont of Dermanyssus gallinae]